MLTPCPGLPGLAAPLKIQSWLRNGTLPGSAAWDEGLLLELQEEAQYFALQGLVDTCQAALQEMMTGGMNPSVLLKYFRNRFGTNGVDF